MSTRIQKQIDDIESGKGKCAICKQPTTIENGFKSLLIDHNTKQVSAAIVCKPCEAKQHTKQLSNRSNFNPEVN